MSLDAAGLVRLWFSDHDLSGAAFGRGPRPTASDVSRLAVLPHPAVQHGHGAGEIQRSHRLALCRFGPGSEFAHHDLRTRGRRTRNFDCDAVAHHTAIEAS